MVHLLCAALLFSCLNITYVGCQTNYEIFDVACNPSQQPYNYTIQTGVILSPNYPQGYNNGVDCRWLISAPQDRMVQIRFTDFLTEPDWDSVHVHDGASINSTHIAKLSGASSNTAFNYSSTQSYMLLRFTSDSSGVQKGFNASFWTTLNENYAVSEVACSSLQRPYSYTAQTGFIVSPNYPQTYRSNTDCRWLISGSVNSIVQLRFTEFSTISGFDFVHIYDGQSTSSPSIASLSGTVHSSVNFVTNQSFMLLAFTTYSNSSGDKGFNATYWTTPFTDYAVSQAACQPLSRPFNCSAQTGVIFSQNYPRSYKANADCRWLISAPEGSFVQIRFTDFSTGNEHYVYVFDGQTTTSSIIVVLSGRYNSPVNYSTNQRYMLMRFTSDSYSYGYRGFNSTYWTISSAEHTVSRVACSSLLQPFSYTTPTGDIVSPKYPKTHISNANCQWLILAPVNSVVLIQFTDFSTQIGDYVNVYDGLSTSSPPIATLTGTYYYHPALNYATTQRYMLLTFIAHRNAYGYRGFNMTFWTNTSTTAPTPFYEDIAFRLVDGPSNGEGRLEVLYYGVWGTVCNKGFDEADTRVACYGLGYGHVGKFLDNLYGSGVGVIWLDNLACTGNESSLGDCPKGSWGVNDCYHSEDVSISCEGISGYSVPSWISGPIIAGFFLIFVLLILLIVLRWKKSSCNGSNTGEPTTETPTNPEEISIANVYT